MHLINQPTYRPTDRHTIFRSVNLARKCIGTLQITYSCT